ncbi:MAG: hypothetical protein AMK75_03160 [Planctomycetes bacterium SM23_65]|nr:MAG: hypothetical protein AMK75_03160 [Planctomycetes bacterium SM23_65]
MKGIRVAAVMTVLAAVLVPSYAGDWPGWRGPTRNGLATDATPLLDALPEGGPKKLWESEPLHGRGGGGHGSPVVAEGRVYVFADWGYNVPKEDRVITANVLNAYGYAPDMPAELSSKVEQARTSEERTKLDRRTLNPWINEWLKANVPEKQKKFRGAAQTRLRAAAQAVPLDVLAKMATVKDKVFPNQQALDQWFKDNGIDDATRKEAIRRVKTTNPASRDFVVCLDAETGKTLWKTEVPSKGGQSHEASTTPVVADGRVYVITASSAVVCLDAKTGNEIWKKTPFEKRSSVHSSVLVADGVVVASSARGTVGLDAGSGEPLWEAKKVRADDPSPVAWKSGNQTCVLINSRKLTCLDAKSGRVYWEAPGGGSATPAVVGDYLACIFRRKLVVYKLAADKAEELWTMEFNEDYASPLIYEGHVYAIGTPRGKKEGRAVCVELATGKVKWDADPAGAPTCASPVVADDKLVSFATHDLLLTKASPDKYQELGRHKIGGSGWPSPAIADGKLFCRIGTKVVCYDLAKQ